jgi:hypothetical protein
MKRILFTLALALLVCRAAAAGRIVVAPTIAADPIGGVPSRFMYEVAFGDQRVQAVGEGTARYVLELAADDAAAESIRFQQHPAAAEFDGEYWHVGTNIPWRLETTIAGEPVELRGGVSGSPALQYPAPVVYLHPWANAGSRYFTNYGTQHPADFRGAALPAWTVPMTAGPVEPLGGGEYLVSIDGPYWEGSELVGLVYHHTDTDLPLEVRLVRAGFLPRDVVFSVPEPGAWGLAGLCGFAAFWAWRR